MESKVISQIAEKLFYKSSKIPEPLQKKGDSPVARKVADSFEPSADVAVAEKEGFFTGSYCTHPLTGGRIPVWIGNFVVMDYGTAASHGVSENRAYEVERAKQLVQENKYSLDDKVIDQIAEKIVAILM